MDPFLAAFLALLLLPGGLSAQGHLLQDRETGLQVLLPDESWKLTDLSSSGVVVHLYSPKIPQVPRVTLMRFPEIFLPKGLVTRAKQIEQIGGKKESFGEGRLAGRKTQRFVYRGQGIRTVEQAFKQGKAWIVFQIAAEEEDWKDEAKGKLYAEIFESVKILEGGPASRPLRVDPKTPGEIRETRKKNEPSPQDFAITRHEVLLRIEPSGGSLSVRDEMELEILGAEVGELELFCTKVEVDLLAWGEKKLEAARKGPSRLLVRLPETLQRGRKLRLRFEGHLDDFRLSEEQELVAEVSVIGQVEEGSSFSSHVLYYPVDQRNDAAVVLSLSVPEGYVAVSGGTLRRVEEKEGRRVFRYESLLRTPRSLPFGFAVGKYEKISARTGSGLELELYFPEGREKEAGQRLEIARQSGALLERLMGPLPWRRVAFCWVKPFEKETGVSLPGQVLFSDGFFQDAEGVELQGANLDDPDALGLLIIADELSHQWNFYSVPLPNELAEGISTFTNLLFLEERRGEEEYRKGVAYCAGAYLAGARTSEDHALADPSLYRSSMYRLVAFCKVPAVLDLLRSRLGKDRFARAWKQAFTELKGNRGGYDSLEKALGRASGTHLRAFFDQWFFQAGSPILRASWEEKVEGARRFLDLELRQVQPGGLFDLRLPLEIEVAGAWKALGTLEVSRREERFRRQLPGPIKGVRVLPEGGSPLIEVRTERRR